MLSTLVLDFFNGELLDTGLWVLVLVVFKFPKFVELFIDVIFVVVVVVDVLFEGSR